MIAVVAGVRRSADEGALVRPDTARRKRAHPAQRQADLAHTRHGAPPLRAKAAGARTIRGGRLMNAVYGLWGIPPSRQGSPGTGVGAVLGEGAVPPSPSGCPVFQGCWPPTYGSVREESSDHGRLGAETMTKNSTLAMAIVILAASAASAQEPPQLEFGDDGVVRFSAWREPALAFAARDRFINNEFLRTEATTLFPSNSIMGFSGGTCPEGWDQHKADDGTPLFFAFGLFVDAKGTPRSEFVKVPACVKQ